MNWVDTGVNLLDPRFVLDEVLNRAYTANVKHILIISSSLEESTQAISLCKKVNTPVSPRVALAATAGIHPHYADQASPDSWIKLSRLIADTSVSAVGECGLDFNRNFSTQKNQLYAFEKQLEIAAKNNKGVYLHERDAFDQQIKLLEQYASSLKFMVAHCFTGNKSQLSTYLQLGCYVGITAWLCDSKRGTDLQQAAQHLPLERLLFETDAPYLFPKTLKPRKSISEPCHLPHIAEYFATHTKQALSVVKKRAYENSIALFFSNNIND